ncbi:MAG: hypothetical protein KKF41_02515 [Actinobacteria bacterium]|nr:hypothetical protein [Actinomycetota bacterium]MBU1945107.1 hypothetical protein [Actinomycetota bacterium]MBU2686442.1 hypothetical protein [Actinomycetota bacterium]
MAIFVGALLDGIPESAAIGLGLATGEGFGLLMLIAVFISNFPEGISGAAGMLASGRSKRFVFWMWGGVTAICALSSLWGYVSLAHAAPDTIAFMLALAAGAILAMISATMIPEAFDDEGRLIPVAVPMATVLGFLAAFIVSRLTT